MTMKQSIFHQNDQRRQEIADLVYHTFLREAAGDDMTEEEWRLRAWRCMRKFAEGIDCSLNAKLMEKEVGQFGREDS